MPAYAPPGTYVPEITQPRAIERAPTSVTCFIGRTLRGPAGKACRINSWIDFDQIFGGLWRCSDLGYAVRHFFANGGGSAVVLRLVNQARTSRASISIAGSRVVFHAAGAGSWGDNVKLSIVESERTAGRFDIEIEEKSEGKIRSAERHQSVSFGGDMPPSGDVLAGSALVRISIEAGESAGESILPMIVQLGGGSDGSAVSDEQVTHEGLPALDAIPFNLLCIPPLSRTTDLAAATHAAAADYCRRRRAFYICDAPRSWSAAADPIEAAVEGMAEFPRSENAAIFFPRVLAPDPLDADAQSDFAPCGMVAGVFSRTDLQRGVWKSPGGQHATLSGASGLQVRLSDAQNGVLNPLAINCLRTFPAQLAVIWGSRTLAGDNGRASEFRYIPVRRLSLLIEESIKQGIRWAALENNDERLWSRLRVVVYGFMEALFRDGAFESQVARDAFFVKCDAETTTQDDVEAGAVNLLVGFAPLKPAEFIVIAIRQATRRA